MFKRMVTMRKALHKREEDTTPRGVESDELVEELTSGASLHLSSSWVSLSASQQRADALDAKVRTLEARNRVLLRRTQRAPALARCRGR